MFKDTAHIKAQKPHESGEQRRSHKRVYVFGAIYASVLIAVVVAFGIIQYRHFYSSMEERLDYQLEGYARTLAQTLPPESYEATVNELALDSTGSFQFVYNTLSDLKGSLGVRRIVVFDDEYKVVVDTSDKLNRAVVDATLRIGKEEIARTIASKQGLAVSTFYELEDTNDTTRLAKTAYARVSPPGEEEAESDDDKIYIVGVELPDKYARDMQTVRLVVALVVTATTIFVILTTLFASRSFVRLQLRFEESRRKAEHSDFSAGIAHELKNPLAAMLTGIQMIERRVPPGDRKAFNRLERQIRSMDRIVKAFLAFARGAQRDPERTTVKAVVSEIQKQLTPAQMRCLRVENTTDKLELVVDQTALVQAVSNLVKNGAQAAIASADGTMQSVQSEEVEESSSGDSRIFRPGEPRVDLHLEQRGRSLVFTVTDNGKGIPDHVKAKLFQPFVSGSHEGTGLGLAIAKRLLDDIGGSIAMVASTKHGTIFQVEIPVVN